MGNNVTVVQENQPLDEVMDERSDEHGVQLDVRVLQDVVQGALGAEVSDQHHAMRFHACADETGMKLDSVMGIRVGVGIF